MLAAVLVPSADATLILGLDARDIAQADGTAVGNWTSTGNGGVGSATQAVANRQPIYRASSTFLGGPGVEFDDTTVRTDSDGMATTVSGLGFDYTVLVLYAYRGTTNDFSRVVQGGTGVRDAFLQANNWLIGPYGGTHQLYDGAFISSGSTSTGPVIATAVGSSTGPEEFFLNGTSAGTNSGSTSPNFFSLGAEGAASESVDADIGLVLVFDNPLTADERVGVEFFMARAYGLAGFTATPAQQAAAAAALGGFLGTSPEAPTDITLAPDSFLASLPVGGEVGVLSSVDINPTDTHSYALVAGAGDTDNARFQIAGDRLQTASSFTGDAGTTFSVRVQSTDSDALSFERAIPVSVVGDSDTDNLSDSWELSFTTALGDLTGLASGPGPGAGTGDFDGDGSSDLEELTNGTDPTETDSDTDGSPDGDEVANGTDPLDPDTDGDGLNDGGETTAGSDPLVADTDGDGISDGDEVNGVPATDPTLADTDGDGSFDNIELALGTNPADPGDFPQSNATLILGLNAHDIIQADGTAVSSWTSVASGGVGNAAQAVAEFQPTYRASSTFLGGLPAVDFNDSLTAAFDGDGMTTTVSGLGADHTIMALYAYRGTTADAARVVQGSDGGRHNFAGSNNWLIGPYNGQHQLYDGGFISSSSDTTAPVIATALGSSARDNEFFLNGASQGANAFNNEPNVVALGAQGAWAEAADSDLGLVLVFDDRLTDRERIGVEYYMAQEYGLEGFDASAAQQAAAAAVLGGFLTVAPAPFEITSVEYLPGGTQAIVTWNSVPGRTYALEYSDDLGAGGFWNELEDSIIGSAGGSTSYTDIFSPPEAVPKRFYRVLVR